MATQSGLRDRARLELGDQGRSYTTTARGDGETTRFTCPFKPLATDLVVVRTPDSGSPVTLALTTDYTVDYRQGIVTLVSAPAATDEVTIQGTAYTYFLDSDLDTFLTTALAQHLHNRSGVTLANLPVVEDYLVVILGVIEALWALLNDAAFDIDISTPEGVQIPRHQRFAQLLQMLDIRTKQYEELAQALNVGLNRVEMFELRRVSRSTGKLVPVYEAQEWNDTRMPRQIFLPIDTKGGSPEPALPGVVEEDIIVTSQQAFSKVITLGVDITGYTAKASVRPYLNGLGSLALFALTVLDAVTGQVRIELTSPQTYYVPRSCFWDLQIVHNTTKDVTTLRQGKLAAIRQGGVGRMG